MKEIKLGNDPLAKALEGFYTAHTKHKVDVLAAEKAAQKARESGREMNKLWDEVQRLKREDIVMPVVPLKPREMPQLVESSIIPKKPERGWTGGVLSLVRP